MIKSLESIKSILNQTYYNLELIIIDDLSDDNSSFFIDKIKDKRIKFFKLKKKLGRTKALNFGLQKCNSNFIAIQDSDDISKPDRLEKCMKVFEENSKIGLISVNFKFINSEGKVEIKKNNLKKLRIKTDNLKFINIIPHTSIIYKRDSFEKDLFYDESFIYAQDYHLILKYFKFSKIYLLNEDLVNIRRHANNMSNNKKYNSIRVKENLKLLNFSYKNFNFNHLELISFIIVLFKNIFKFLFFTIKR